jgi:hypothetical protein
MIILIVLNFLNTILMVQKKLNYYLKITKKRLENFKPFFMLINLFSFSL